MDRDRSPKNARAVLRRRRWTLASAVCAGLALASVASLALPRTWRATARVEVTATRPMEADEFASETEAVRQRILAPEALDAAAAAIRADGLTGSAIASGTVIAVETQAEGPARLRIDHRCADAATSVRVVEHLLAGLRKEVYDRPRIEAEARIAALEADLAAAAERADEAKAAADAHAARHVDLLGPLDEQRRTVQEDVTRVTDEIRDLEERLRTAEANLAAEPQFQKQDVRKVDTARLSAVEQELAELNSRLEDLTQTRRYAADHPDVRAAKSRIAELVRSKGEIEAAAPVETVLRENPLYAEYARLRGEAQAGLRVAKQRLQSLHRTDRDIQQRIVQVPPVRAEHEKLAAAAKETAVARDAVAAELARQKEALASIETSRTLEFAVVEDAALPRTPAGPGPVLYALGGLALGAVAGLAAAFVADSRDRSFRDVEAAAAFLGLPALGAVGTIEMPAESAARRKAETRTEWTVASAAIAAVLLAGWAVWAGTSPPREKAAAADGSTR